MPPVHTISNPFVRKDVTGYFYGWYEGNEQDVAVGITNIIENYKQHVISAEMSIGLDGNKYSEDGNVLPLLTFARVNLLSISSRQAVIKTIRDNCFTEELRYYPWDKIVNQTITLTINELRKGEQSVEIGVTQDYKEPEYILYPYIIKDNINTFYADRSSAKTLFATLLNVVLSLPWSDNPINLVPPPEPKKVLYLDWESNKEIMEVTLGRLLKGTKLEYCSTHYRHCALPLPEDIGNIKKAITKDNIDTIIIDSLGMAVGDDLNLTAPAFRFFSALRQLDPITSIILGHTAKNIEGRRKTVYGNAYYENEARNIWELIKKQQQPDSTEINVTLFHRKPPPFAGIHFPMAYIFTFNNRETFVSLGEVEGDSNNSDGPAEIEVVEQIISESDKPLQPKEIYEILDHEISQSNIRSCLFRLKKSGKITHEKDGYVTNALQ